MKPKTVWMCSACDNVYHTDYDDCRNCGAELVEHSLVPVEPEKSCDMCMNMFRPAGTGLCDDCYDYKYYTPKPEPQPVKLTRLTGEERVSKIHSQLLTKLSEQQHQITEINERLDELEIGENNTGNWYKVLKAKVERLERKPGDCLLGGGK